MTPIATPLLVSPEIVLNRLRQAIGQCTTETVHLKPLDTCLAEYDVKFWRTLQSQLVTNTRAYGDVCCVLACLGEDTSENIDRLLLPYRHYRRHLHASSSFPEDRETYARLNDLPGYLSLLYRKYPEPQILALLLEIDLLPHPAYLEYVTALVILWDYHAEALVSAVLASPLRRHRLASALAFACQMVNEPALWRSYYRDLQRLIHSRERPVMYCAQRLLAQIKLAQRRC